MLRAALAEINDAEFPAFTAPSSQAADVARQLKDRYGDGQETVQSPDERRALLRRLRLAQYQWDKVVPADRLHVAWVLWDGAAPPAEHEVFLSDYLAWLDVPNRRYQAVRLALSWIEAFDPALKSIAIVGDWLAARSASLPEPWPTLAKDFDLFSSANGPTALAEAFLGSDEPAADFFARIQLQARATSGGLILEMLAVGATATDQWALEDPRLASRLCALAVDGTTFRPDTTLARASGRAAALRNAIAEALLLPWQEHEPPVTIKTQIIAFLVAHYGDPRIAPQQWATLHPHAAAMMRYWLTEQAVATYFALARRSKTADRGHLAEREQFWMARIAEIDNAWLLANPQSLAALGLGPMAFGRLGGYRPDQAALLLRVGETTILELSHEASETVWLPGNPFAPALYRGAGEIYWPRTLTNGPDYSSAYSPSGAYNWQERLTNFLDRN